MSDQTISKLINAVAADIELQGGSSVQDVWREHPDNQFFVLSSEEALVLDIAPSKWPRMLAAIHAFEACSGFCDDGKYPTECRVEVARDRPDIPLNMENVEAFAAFCVAFAGLKASEAYRAWYKWELWHFRSGHHTYPISGRSDR